MLKKTITYNNIDGVQVTKDLYFNISSIELTEKEALSDQTYSQRLAEIGKSNKLSEIYPAVMEFLQDGYGVRTGDDDFQKSHEEWLKFKNSLAYDALMEDLLFDPANNGNKLAEFITGMLPPEIAARVREQTAQPGFRPGADTSRPTPPVVGQPEATQPIYNPTPVQAEKITDYIQPVPAEPQPVPPVQISDSTIQETGLVSDHNNQPVPEEVIVQQTSEPRTPDLPGQPQQ